MLRRLEHYAMVAAGLGFALVGAVSLVLAPNTSGLNRLPAERPPLVGHGVTQQSYRDAWEDYLADKLAIASLGRRANAALERGLFGDSATAQVIRGREGWLYFRPAVTAWDLPVEQWQGDGGASSVIFTLREAGLETRFALAPHKPTQYPQYLPANDRVLAEEGLVNQRLRRDAMTRAYPGEVIDIFDDMADAIAANPDQLYYLPEDTHWSDLGAGIMARAVVESFLPGRWDADAFVATAPKSYRPDLPQMEGRDIRLQQDGFAVSRPGVSVDMTRGDGSSGWTRRFQTTSEGAPLGGKLVLIGDSYSIALAPLIAPYFEEVVWVRLRDLDPEAAAPVILAADLALVMIVERNANEPAPNGPYDLGWMLSEAMGLECEPGLVPRCTIKDARLEDQTGALR